MASSKKRSRAVVTVLLCLAAVCLVAALVFFRLVSRRVQALQAGDTFDFAYTVSAGDGTASPVLYSILQDAGATQGQVTGLYSPGQLQLTLTASGFSQPLTRIYVDADETLFDAGQLYTTLRDSVTARYPLAGALLPEWSMGSYISQSQLASVLGVQASQIALQDMTGFTLTLSRQQKVQPSYAKQGYTYYRIPAEGENAPVLVLGLPLKALLSEDPIPVDIHLEIPAHNVTVALSGTVTPSLNTILFPASRIEDSDIASFVQLRQTLEQILQLVQSTLNALS